MVLKTFLQGSNGETDMENRLKGEMHGESNMETYITIYKTESQGNFAVCLRKLKQGLCINLEGLMGREIGGRFKREGIYV